MRFAYPYVMASQPEGGFTVTFPDLPEAITEADGAEEVAVMAADSLVTALSFYADDGRSFPPPSAPRGAPVALVPPLVAAKMALHEAMLAARVSNAELARLMGADEKTVRRLRDLLHRSHIGQVEAALRLLGKRLEIRVLDAPFRSAA